METKSKNLLKIVRLNSKTCPLIIEEKKILSSVNASIVEIEGISDEEIIRCSKDCDALMVISAYVRSITIKALKACKVISRLGTGIDKIDIEQATRQGIMVTNLPDFCTNEVADHTMALLLASARRLNFFQNQIQLGKHPKINPNIHCLSTQKLGIIGFGKIGKVVAERAKPFGLKVMVVDPKISKEDANAVGVELVNMNTILLESDYLCLLCPLLSSTRQLLSLKEFKKMKPTAILINTGRGELVNENDLAIALQQRIISYAAIDVFGDINVFSPDGFKTDHPFFSLDNIMMTPHVSAMSVESMLEQRIRGAQAVVDVLSGIWPKHLVNKDVKPWFKIKNSK